MSQELVVTTRNEVAKIMSTMQPKMPIGLGMVKPQTLGIRASELKIIHAIRGQNEVGRPGQLRLGRESFPQFDFRVLVAHEFREYREGERENSRVVCASNTMETPLAEIEVPRAEHCQRCPYAQWTEGPSKKRVPPPCGPAWALLGAIDREVDGTKTVQPFWFLARKSAAQPVRKLLEAFLVRDDIECLAQATVRLTTEENNNKGVIWYTPVFTVVGEIMPMEEIPLHKALAEEIMARQLRYIPRVSGVAADAVEGAGGDDDEEVAEVIPAGKTASMVLDDEIPF